MNISVIKRFARVLVMRERARCLIAQSRIEFLCQAIRWNTTRDVDERFDWLEIDWIVSERKSQYC